MVVMVCCTLVSRLVSWSLAIRRLPASLVGGNLVNICAQTLKGWKNTDHKNLMLAHRAESWILDRIGDLATSPEIVEGALEHAQRKCHSELEPERDRLALNWAALERNQAEVDQMLASITSGRASGALLEMLNEKAYELKMEREGLKAEQRRLVLALQPLESSLDAGAFNEMFSRFSEVAQGADPEKLQKLLRLMIRRIEWMPDGTHSVEYFGLPTDGKAKNWFYTMRRSDGPDHRGLKPVVLRLIYRLNKVVAGMSTVLSLRLTT